MRQHPDFDCFGKQAAANGGLNGIRQSRAAATEWQEGNGAAGQQRSWLNGRGHGAHDVAVRIPGWKRALDVSLILLTSPLWVPLMGLLALVIRLVSPGPVLFRQERVGFRAQRFTCFKFRTMVVDADPLLHQGHLRDLLQSDRPMIKMDVKGDPRLIPFGRLLRASGLDELPQLFNVLRGEMSLVGPRPCMPYEFEQYQPWQMERFNAVPGLTGLWQVSGKNRTTFNEMIRLDIQYARHASLWLDLKIIFRTVPALLAQMREQRAERRAVAQNGQGAKRKRQDARHSPGATPLEAPFVERNYFSRT